LTILPDLLRPAGNRELALSLRTSSAFLFMLAALASPAGAPVQAQGAAACGGPASATRFYVYVQRVRSASGLIAVTVYGDNPRKFLAKRGALYVVRVPARAPRTRVCVHLPAPGIYGLGVYHDADGDRAIDRTGVGLPAEDFGFSNNPRLLFGIPSFSSVRLSVPRTGMWTTIRLRQP
jgi:uncharacterized protein (DUF2141 family)